MRSRRFYSPGDGGGTPSSPQPDPAPETPAPETPETPPEEPKEPPKYFSQLNPEKAQSEAYRALYPYAKIEDLCDHVLELEKEKSETAEKYKRYIEVPDAKDPEKVQEFARKLGVPDDPAGYKVPFLDGKNMDEATALPIKKAFKDAMLTQGQANAMGRMLANVAKSGLEAAKARLEAMKSGFDGSLAATYTEIQMDADRKSAAEKDKTAFEAFAQETGLKEMLEKNGMAWNPQFVKAVGSYARSHAGQRNPDRSGGGKPGSNTPTNPYGDDFNRRYGGRHA